MGYDLLKQVHYNDKIKSLKKDIVLEKLPIYIYGAGSYAKSTIQLIRGAEKKVEACVVDDVFYRKDCFVEGVPVVSVSRFIDRIDSDVSIIMGMSNFLAGERLKAKCLFVRKIYYPTSLSFEKGKELTKEYLIDNIEKFSEIYGLLADELSKQCFIAWIDSAIHNDTTRMFHVSEGVRSYFNNSLFKVRQGSTLVDVGAYTGDTIEEFLDATGNVFRKIWAVEGDAGLCAQIREVTDKKKISEKVEIFNNCVWNEEKDITVNYLESEISSVGMTASESKEGEQHVHVVTLDSLLENRNGLKVDMLKVAMRGAEKILEGAVHIIKMDHPIIAAKVGFDRILFYDVIRMILEIDSTYKIYFRFNNSKLEELILYAIK